MAPENCLLRQKSSLKLKQLARISGSRTQWSSLEKEIIIRTPVNAIAFSPDGHRIVSGSSDSTVQIWDADTGELVREPLKDHIDAVLSVAFSPNGHRIVSGSDDCTVRIWDAKTGDLVRGPFKGHTRMVLSVAFSPDGHRIVSGSSDRTVRIWNTAIFSQDAQPGAFSFSPYASHAINMNCDAEDSLEGSRPILQLDTEGWVVDAAAHPPSLILWIPPESRPDMYTPYTCRVIGKPVTSLDLSNFAHGARWTKCYEAQGVNSSE